MIKLPKVTSQVMISRINGVRRTRQVTWRLTKVIFFFFNANEKLLKYVAEIVEKLNIDRPCKDLIFSKKASYLWWYIFSSWLLCVVCVPGVLSDFWRWEHIEVVNMEQFYSHKARTVCQCECRAIVHVALLQLRNSIKLLIKYYDSFN